MRRDRLIKASLLIVASALRALCRERDVGKRAQCFRAEVTRHVLGPEGCGTRQLVGA